MADVPIYTDNARGYLNAAVTTGATSIVLQAGYGASFPSPAAGQYAPAIIRNVDGAREQVNITGRSGDTLTVVRARNGTTALEWGLGDEIFVTVRAAELALSKTTVPSYDTLADAVAATDWAAVDGRSVIIGGPQGGLFIVDAAASGTADGGIVIDVNGGAQQLVRQGSEYALPQWFGAVGDGATNDTAALLAFFNYCIDNEKPGRIPAGTYVVTLGSLAFDNGFTDTSWPVIETDGHLATKLKAAANIDAPFLSITNGTATSGVSQTWKGGRLGGLTFVKADTGSTAALSSMHGLMLRGITETRFGYMKADDLGGDTIHLEQALYGGTNPDPYNVFQCVFDGVEGNGNYGRAFTNDNYVGFTGCKIGHVRAIECVEGAFFGQGASNSIDGMSVGSCGGWAIGEQSDVTGGAPTRFRLGGAEFDNVENGIDGQWASNSDYGIVRFVHRYNFGALNPSGGYWPRTALKVGNASRAVNMVRYRVIDRIESGGTKGDMGEFADFVSAGGNLIDCHIERQVLDNAGFGFDSADLFVNFNSNSGVRYTDNAYRVIDTLVTCRNGVRARASAGSLANSGFTTTGIVQYNTVLSGDSANYDTGTYEYTIRGRGRFRVFARLAIALTAGQRVRMAILRNGSAAVAKYQYASTANVEGYEIDATLDLVDGDVISITADQNSGTSSISLSTFLSADDNLLEIQAL